MSNWQKIQIKYETQNIPAPFSFEIKAALIKNSSLDVNFLLRYTDREGLDEEEILDEGFSGDDDIEWKGILPQPWLNSLDSLLEKTTWTQKVSPLSQSNITVYVDGSSKGHPSNADKWEYWIQELQQACLEAGKMEKPLEIDFVKGSKKISIKASFTTREASLHDFSTGAADKRDLEWSQLRKLLKHIYQADFNPEEAAKQATSSGERFLNLGGGQWYNLEKASLHVPKKRDWLEKLDNLLNGQFSDPSA